MWPDNETSRDFLNFSGVAESVAEVVRQANGRPVSIGVSGAWGSGKSSLIKLVRASLEKQDGSTPSAFAAKGRDFVFVEFNAWLYQGYDDARAALMDVIASKLQEEAEARQTGVEKVKSLLGRINWLRAAKLAGGSGLALAMGLPPVGLFGDLWKLVRKAGDDGVDENWIAEAEKHADRASTAAVDLVKRSPPTSPPKEIQAVRDAFEEALAEMGVTLVVLIDDLDRCLPETTISTLEAVRLFLFLKDTAFIVAADNDMIRHAVRRHFAGVENESLVTSYFDKLIQVPIRVPPLGTQDVRAYMMLLFVDNSELDDEAKEKIRDGVCGRLSNSWRGERVDRKFIELLHDPLPDGLAVRLDTAERLAPLMAGASGITGNPRLVKRFLNALSIRMAISRAQGVGVDEAVLAKLLLFERLAKPEAYAQLATAANLHDEGWPELLSEWEAQSEAGKTPELEGAWDDDFVREWLQLAPQLADVDLRGALYVSREHAPLIAADERLSSDGAELLAALLNEPEEAQALSGRLTQLPRTDSDLMMGRLLEKARREQRWGTPPILDACLALAIAMPGEAQRLADFLGERPTEQLEPDIAPKIGDQPWAADVFDRWLKKLQDGPVRRAIKSVSDNSKTGRH
jgi:predicted KAP-like P-loop ATPase